MSLTSPYQSILLPWRLKGPPTGFPSQPLWFFSLVLLVLPTSRRSDILYWPPASACNELPDSTHHNSTIFAITCPIQLKDIHHFDKQPARLGLRSVFIAASLTFTTQIATSPFSVSKCDSVYNLMAIGLKCLISAALLIQFPEAVDLEQDPTLPGGESGDGSRVAMDEDVRHLLTDHLTV